jgi:hypothetical protein
MPALRAGLQVRIDGRPLVGGGLAIDIGGKQRIDFPATRH